LCTDDSEQCRRHCNAARAGRIRGSRLVEVQGKYSVFRIGNPLHVAYYAPKLQLVATHNLGKSSRQTVHILMPKEFRTNAVASTDPEAVVEVHCGIVRGGYKLACKASPAGAELRQINPLAVRKLMLKNPEVRKAKIENRRRVKNMSISEDSRVRVKPRVPLAGG